jgi:hypothetical protein
MKYFMYLIGFTQKFNSIYRTSLSAFSGGGESRGSFIIFGRFVHEQSASKPSRSWKFHPDARFGRKHTRNQTEVLVAVESIDWVDAKEHKKTRAGFAKIMVASETKQKAQEFIDRAIEKRSMVNTAGSPSLIDLKNVDVDYQVTRNDKETLNRWLPWVHKFISNAKTWMMGTHHGVESKISYSVSR